MECTNRISIITPYYQGRKYIVDLLESIKCQDFDNCEHIIINDGCKGEMEYLTSLKFKYHFNLFYQTNRGQSAAVNAGLAYSTGNIISWINQDDCFCAGTFTDVDNIFRYNENVNIIYGQGILLDDTGKDIFHIKSHDFSYTDLLNKSNFIVQPSVFFKRSVLEREGFLRDNLKFAMDYDLWLRLGRKYEFYFIRKPLAKFRIHKDSKSFNNQLRFIPEKLRIIKDNGGYLLSPICIKMYIYLLKEPLRIVFRAIGKGNVLYYRSFLPRKRFKEINKSISSEIK